MQGIWDTLRYHLFPTFIFYETYLLPFILIIIPSINPTVINPTFFLLKLDYSTFIKLYFSSFTTKLLNNFRKINGSELINSPIFKHNIHFLIINSGKLLKYIICSLYKSPFSSKQLLHENKNVTCISRSDALVSDNRDSCPVLPPIHKHTVKRNNKI